MVSVSHEALNIVKSALNDFKTDISALPQQSDSSAQKIKEECSASIGQTAGELSVSENRIVELKTQEQFLEDKIRNGEQTINRLKESQASLQERLNRVDRQISDLHSQISSLDVQFRSEENEEFKKMIAGQISSAKENLNCLNDQQYEMKKQSDEITVKKNATEKEVSSAKTDKLKVEEKLSKEEIRRDKLQRKLDRQKNEYKHVESDLEAYLSAVKKFESSSKNAAQQSSSALNECISSIDSYLAVNL